MIMVIPQDTVVRSLPMSPALLRDLLPRELHPVRVFGHLLQVNLQRGVHYEFPTKIWKWVYNSLCTTFSEGCIMNSPLKYGKGCVIHGFFHLFCCIRLRQSFAAEACTGIHQGGGLIKPRGCEKEGRRQFNPIDTLYTRTYLTLMFEGILKKQQVNR